MGVNVISRSPRNLVRFSEQFDNAIWGKSGGTSITANDDTAPNGTVTADRWNSAGGANDNIQQNMTVRPLTTYCYSLWVKRGTMIEAKYAVYNVTTPGWIIAPTSYYASINGITYTRVYWSFITPVGCISLNIYPHMSGGIATPAGNMYLWGAQVNYGVTPDDYFETDEVARH